MVISTDKSNNATVGVFSGRMDATTAASFDTWFSERAASGDNTLVLDMTALEYISSAGLRSLLSAAKQAKAKSGELILCGLSGTVEEVFRISGFLAIFRVFPTLRECLDSIA